MKKQIPFGKYLLLDRINVGGMAEVYKAKTVGVEGFEKLLAIKRILPNIAEDDEFIEMFIDEAKISVQLTHANIAQIYDLGKIADSYFIAMEYISGKDMRGIFDRMRKRGEPAPVPMTCYMVSKLCEGLDYAHRKKDAAGRDLGIVHRDISPQNLLISFEGEVKVIDFGIAKAANKASKTQAGILKGKFGYMSPEQVRGLPLDRRSDVFACGVCLFEQLTGERLFHGESDFSTLEKVRNVDVVLPSTFNPRIPPSLDAIVMKALAKDVEDRYQWASELGDDLQRFLITSDSIFGRADLSNFMKATFAEDLEREKVKNQEALAGEDDAAPASSSPSFFDEDLPGEAPGADATQLFDPTAAFDEGQGGPAGGGVSGIVPPPLGGSAEATSPGGGTVPGRPTVGDSTTPGFGPGQRPGFGPGPGQRPGFGPGPGQRPSPNLGPGQRPPGASGPGQRPAGGRSPAPPPTMQSSPQRPPRLDYEPGSLASLEDDDDEGMPTVAEELPGRARGRAPAPQAKKEPKKKREKESSGAGKAFAYLGMLFLVLGAAAAGGYYYLEREVAPATGIIIVRGQPLGADILIDGVRVGQVPFVDSKAIVGARNLTVESDGFDTHEEQLFVLPGQTSDITVRLQESRAQPASVLVVSVPLDARVRFNDAVVKEGGETPWQSQEIESGKTHLIVIDKDGYWPQTVEWTAQPGEHKAITVTLQKSSARLEVVSRPSRADVFLDDRRVGQTPLTLNDLDGSKRYQLEVKGGRCLEDWSSTLIFDSSAERKVEVVLEQIPGCGAQQRRPPTQRQPATKAAPEVAQGTGTLSLNTRPGWAWVIINGRETERHTPLVNYELPAGTHTVLLRAPDGRERTVSVTIRPDQMTRQTVDLQ